MSEQVDRLVRESECKHLTSISRATRFRLEREGLFPQRVQIGHGITAWRLSDLKAWMRDLPSPANDEDY